MKVLILVLSFISVSAYAQKQIDLSVGDSITIAPNVKTTVTCSGDGYQVPQATQKCVCYEVEDEAATWYYKTKFQLVHVTKFADGRVSSKILKEFDYAESCKKQSAVMLECKTDW